MPDEIVYTSEAPPQQLSLQGEQQRRRQNQIWASDGAVDAYVAQTPDEILECRGRFRHFFPSPRSSMSFSRKSAQGYHIRRVGCEVCKYPEGHEKAGEYRVVRVETWDLKTGRGKQRGYIVRSTLLRHYTLYLDPNYQVPEGMGRAKPKQIQNSLGTNALEGVKLVDLDTQITENQRAEGIIPLGGTG